MHQGIRKRQRSKKKQGKDRDLKKIEVWYHMYLFYFLIEISNCDRSMMLMILWHEYETIRAAMLILWLQQKHELVILDRYVGLNLQHHIDTRISL